MFSLFRKGKGRAPAAPLHKRPSRSHTHDLGETHAQGHHDGERQGRRRRDRSQDPAGAVPARELAPDRHARRLRHQPVRRLRGASRRPRGEVVHGAGGLLRRRQGHDHRGPGQGRQAASHAGGLPPASRPAMRLLYARHDHGGRRARAAQGRQPRRAHHPRGARGQPVPLHGLSQHRRRRESRRRHHGRRAASRKRAE